MLPRSIDADEPRRHVDARQRGLARDGGAEDPRLGVDDADREVATLVDASAFEVEDVVGAVMRGHADLVIESGAPRDATDERGRAVVVLEVATAEWDSRSRLGVVDQPGVKAVGRVQLVRQSRTASPKLPQ